MIQDDEWLAASEIAQYAFCNVSWYLNKEGVARDRFSNARLQTGRVMHARLDRKISTYSSLSIVLTVAAVAVSILLAVLLLW